MRRPELFSVLSQYVQHGNIVEELQDGLKTIDNISIEELAHYRSLANKLRHLNLGIDDNVLINRLINEHNDKKQGATAGSPLVGSPLLHTEDSGNSGRLLDSTNEGVSNSYNNSEVEDAMNRIGDDSLFYASDLFQYKPDNADMPELGISQSVTINRNKRPTDYSSFDSSNAAGGHGKHRYLKSKDDLELEAQISRKKEYTFKPQLSSKVVNSNNKSRSNISSRIEEMNQQREHAIRAREKQKKELEEFEIGTHSLT
jgi:hypothetical protein